MDNVVGGYHVQSNKDDSRKINQFRRPLPEEVARNQVTCRGKGGLQCVLPGFQQPLKTIAFNDSSS
jgi:hypothetical protein